MSQYECSLWTISKSSSDLIVWVDGVEVVNNDVSVFHLLAGVFDGVDGVWVQSSGLDSPSPRTTAAASNLPTPTSVHLQPFANLVHRRRHILEQLHRLEYWNNKFYFCKRLICLNLTEKKQVVVKLKMVGLWNVVTFGIVWGRQVDVIVGGEVVDGGVGGVDAAAAAATGGGPGRVEVGGARLVQDCAGQAGLQGRGARPAKKRNFVIRCLLAEYFMCTFDASPLPGLHLCHTVDLCP